MPNPQNLFTVKHLTASSVKLAEFWCENSRFETSDVIEEKSFLSQAASLCSFQTCLVVEASYSSVSPCVRILIVKSEKTGCSHAACKQDLHVFVITAGQIVTVTVF